MVEAQLLGELSSAGQVGAGAGQGRVADTGGIESIQKSLLKRIGELIKDEFPDVNRDYRPLIDEYLYQAIQLRTSEQKLDKLDGFIRTFERNVELAPQLAAEQGRLQAEVDQNRTLYEQFLRARTQTSIAGAAQETGLSTTIVVVEDATFPLEPVKPNKIKILMMAAMFGLSLGMGGLLFTEFSDTSFRSVEEVEKKMGIRVIGTVPKIETMGGNWKGENRVKRAAIWTTTAVVLATVAVFAFYFYGKTTKENMVSFRVSKSQQTAGDRN
jgi:hypothetical protein